MMRVAIIVLAILLFSVILTVAQDTPVENWCESGGRWDDGRCGQGSLDEQTWHWTCGWYMAQVDKGDLTIDNLRVNVPDCESLYPPRITLNNASGDAGFGFPPGVCVINTGSGGGIDRDCDGLLDSWENSYFGDLYQNGTDDPDNDLCDNACEQINGTAPI